MSFYLSVSPSFSHTLLTFAKSALKIYIRFPFDLDENTSSKRKITNQRKCENVSYDFIAIKNVFWLAVCFLNSCEKRRTRKARRKKQSNKNSQNILEHSGTLCFCLVCGFIWCELFKTSNKLYIIVLLVSIERQWDWLTHTLTSAHSDTQTHTWLVLKWNSSNENRCLSRNYCFSLSTINLNPMQEKRRDVCAPNDFRLPNDFQISVKTICCSFSLLLFVSFRLCDEMFFFPYGPCLVECV